MSLSLKLETCEIFLSYAIAYRRPPSCFYCGGCPAHVSPYTPAVDMRTSWLLCVVICLTFDPNNTSREDVSSRNGHAYFMDTLRGYMPKI